MAWSSASISLKVWWARWCALRSRQTASMSLSSGAYFGSHSTVSQWARAASAARESLLVWIGPLSSTRTTGLAGRPGLGPYASSSCWRWATKSLLRLVGLVCTIRCRVTWSNEPSIATFRALTGCRHPQVGAGLRPGPGEVGMGQRLALVAIQQHDV